MGDQMSEDAVKEFVRMVAIHFPLKLSEDNRANWLASMQDELKDYLPSEIDTAARHIVKTRTHKSFPLPSECIEACERARKQRNITQIAATLPALQSPIDTWAPDRVERADKMICCEAGLQAAEQGWLLGLWHHCRVHGCFPDAREEQAIRKEAGRFTETVSELRKRVKRTPKTRKGLERLNIENQLLRWADAMLERTREKQRLIWIWKKLQ